MSLNVPRANAPRGQTTSAPRVVETVAGHAMHSAIQHGDVISPRLLGPSLESLGLPSEVPTLSARALLEHISL